MTSELNRLRRQESTLEEAEGLLSELKAKAVTRGEFDEAMVALETGHRDLPVLTDVRMDPHGEGYRVTSELAHVREQIGKLFVGKKT